MSTGSSASLCNASSWCLLQTSQQLSHGRVTKSFRGPPASAWSWLWQPPGSPQTPSRERHRRHRGNCLSHQLPEAFKCCAGMAAAVRAARCGWSTLWLEGGHGAAAAETPCSVRPPPFSQQDRLGLARLSFTLSFCRGDATCPPLLLAAGHSLNAAKKDAVELWRLQRLPGIAGRQPAPAVLRAARSFTRAAHAAAGHTRPPRCSQAVFIPPDQVSKTELEKKKGKTKLGSCGFALQPSSATRTAARPRRLARMVLTLSCGFSCRWPGRGGRGLRRGGPAGEVLQGWRGNYERGEEGGECVCRRVARRAACCVPAAVSMRVTEHHLLTLHFTGPTYCSARLSRSLSLALVLARLCLVNESRVTPRFPR